MGEVRPIILLTARPPRGFDRDLTSCTWSKKSPGHQIPREAFLHLAQSLICAGAGPVTNLYKSSGICQVSANILDHHASSYQPTMITMGSRATLFGLYALSALTVHAAQGVLRPYELTLHRDPESLQCNHLILRDAQPFRALPDEGYLKSKRLETGEERIKFIARDDDRVWALAEALCGAKSTWNFQTLIGGDFAQLEKDELVLRAAQDDPLPLEVEPLETSGDPSKRVDLVFFADGCT